MKRVVIFSVMLAIFLAISAVSQAQFTAAERQQLRDVENRVKKLDNEIKALRARIGNDKANQWDQLNYQLGTIEGLVAELDQLDSIYINYKESMYDSLASVAENANRAIIALEAVKPTKFDQLRSKMEEKKELEQTATNIFRKYSLFKGVPPEMKDRQLRHRLNANIARRQEMTLQIDEKNLSAYTSSDSAGYRVILKNFYTSPVDFVITPLDGGQSGRNLLSSGQELTVRLIAGQYLVNFYLNGQQLSPVKVVVDGTLKTFLNKKCFGYAYVGHP